MDKLTSYRGHQVVFVLTGLVSEGCSQRRDTSIGPSPEKACLPCSGLVFNLCWEATCKPGIPSHVICCLQSRQQLCHESLDLLGLSCKRTSNFGQPDPQTKLIKKLLSREGRKISCLPARRWWCNPHRRSRHGCLRNPLCTLPVLCSWRKNSGTNPCKGMVTSTIAGISTFAHLVSPPLQFPPHGAAEGETSVLSGNRSWK